MAAPIRTPRKKWVQQGLRTLARGGPDAVRIEPLAQALGVSKGGFYWHFDDRGALLEEMLETWERSTTEAVVERLEREGGGARAKLRRLFELTSPSVLMTDLAVRDWARREPKVAKRLRRVDNRRMEYLRSLFGELHPAADDIEARCLLAFSLLIGNHFIAADHDALSREEVLDAAVKRLSA